MDLLQSGIPMVDSDLPRHQDSLAKPGGKNNVGLRSCSSLCYTCHPCMVSEFYCCYSLKKIFSIVFLITSSLMPNLLARHVFKTVNILGSKLFLLFICKSLSCKCVANTIKSGVFHLTRVNK